MTKRIRGIIAATAAALLCLPVIAVFGFSAANADEWSPAFTNRVYLWNGDLSAAGWAGEASIPTDQESGTETYEKIVEDGKLTAVNIHNASAFAYFAHEASVASNNGFEGVTVNLMCDIDLDGKNNIWLPIGLDTRKNSTKEGGVAFRGTFDGKGHTVYNLNSAKFSSSLKRGESEFYVQASDTLTVTYPAALDKDPTYEYVYGLFGNVGNAVIKNLNISNVKIDLPAKDLTDPAGKTVTLVTDCVGAVAGYAAGDLKLENITVGNANGEDYINHTLSTGGLVGRAYAGKKNGAPLGSPAGNDNGNLDAGVTLGKIEVTNCVNYINLGTDEIGDKNGGITGDKRAGIFGYVHGVGDFTIQNCKNYGDIVAAYAGGAVSYIRPNANWHRTSDGKAVALKYNFDGFTNYGDIQGKYGDVPVNRTTESMWVGGVIGKLEDMVADSKTSIYEGTKTVGFTDCVNYGTVTCENADFHASVPEVVNSVVNSHYVGGIIGYLRSNKNTTVKFDGLNYGDIKAYGGDITIETNDNLYAAGLIGAVYFANETDAANSILSGANAGEITGKGRRAGCFGNYANGKLDSTKSDYRVNAFALTDTHSSISAPVNTDNVATLVYADDVQTVVTGINKTANGFDATKAFEVVIPDSVTQISAKAFIGLTNLVKVSFGNYSKLETIGDFAFAGTGLYEAVLPTSLKTIGIGAFAGCTNLASVTIPASVTTVKNMAFGNLEKSATFNISNVNAAYGDYVFDKGSYIVVENRAAYAAAADSALNAYIKDVTYVVTIEYDYLGTTIATESRLYGKDYKVVLQNGAWMESSSTTLGTALTKNMVWYSSANGDNDSLVNNDNTDIVSDMLKAANVETIRLYAFDKGEGRVFFARNNLAYDGKAYGMNELNSLLYDTSDKITARMTATIASYVDPDGNAASADALPAVVKDAGRYGIKVVEDGAEYGFEINIARAAVNLGDYNDVLSWKLVSVGAANVNMELRNENGLTLYVYTYADGGAEYPTLTRLSDSEIVELGLNETFSPRFVRYSVVRNRNNVVSIGIAGGMTDEAFEVEYESEGNIKDSARDIGVYTACAKLTALPNYTLALDGIDGGAARGITINVAQDGKSAIVYKVWYIVDVNNFAVTDDGAEYFINNRVYGDSTVVSVPRLMYGDVQPSDYGTVEDPVTLTLTLNGNITVGTFTRDSASFLRYINASMPAGRYSLEISARSVTSSEVDENGVAQSIHHDAFEDTITFTVEKQAMPTLITNRINQLLRNAEFTYVYDGSSHFYYDDIRVEVETALSSVPAAGRSGTVWGEARYADLFGAFDITFNLARMVSDVYYSADAMPIQTSGPDRYTVFYKVSAPNYYDSIEGAVRTDSYFYVVNVMSVNIPTAAAQAYNGEVIVADIPYSNLYTVTDNNGGTRVGEYDVELTLNQPEFYMWDGQTLETKTATMTVKFEIVRATNSWAIEPGVKLWVEGKYDTVENAVFGKPALGTPVIVITDSKNNVVFDSSKNINDLAGLEAGTYLLSATVESCADYDGLSFSMFVNVFEKPGLPWWGILAIVLGSLLIAAIIIFILWKKGVFQILTGKIVLAIRTQATIDATIASVRASKIAAQSKASRAEAEAKDKAEERAQARREAAEAERAKSNDEKAAELEAKAQAEVERANQILAKANAMQERAAAMKTPVEPEEEAPKKSKKSKKAAAEEPKAEDAATEPSAESADTASDSDVNNPTEE